MEKKKYDKAKELDERIFQLNLLKRYMEVLLEKKPFFMTLATTILNVETVQTFPPMNLKNDTLYHGLNYEEDKQLIINTIENRIIELQAQFDNL
jgi:hypothetical protein